MSDLPKSVPHWSPSNPMVSGWYWYRDDKTKRPISVEIRIEMGSKGMETTVYPGGYGLQETSSSAGPSWSWAMVAGHGAQLWSERIERPTSPAFDEERAMGGIADEVEEFLRAAENAIKGAAERGQLVCLRNDRGDVEAVMCSNPAVSKLLGETMHMPVVPWERIAEKYLNGGAS